MGKSRFQDDWLKHPEYSKWLARNPTNVWSPSFINPVACSASLLPPGAVFSLVSVSVARLFFFFNPPLFSGLGTGRRFSRSIFQAELTHFGDKIELDTGGTVQVKC